jgi:predicted flap endonuclease-1-like 5' DNA nuclease
MSKIARALPIVVGLSLLLSHGPARASTYPLANILPKEAAEKLDKVGVKTSDDLLEKGATAAERTKLAKTTGLAAKQLFEWVRMADLLRIKGVGPVMVRLLGAAGVVSVAQLKTRNAKNLYAKVMKANEKEQITKNPPSEKHLENWIEQAKQLKVVVK